MASQQEQLQFLHSEDKNIIFHISLPRQQDDSGGKFPSTGTQNIPKLSWRHNVSPMLAYESDSEIRMGLFQAMLNASNLLAMNMIYQMQ